MSRTVDRASRLLGTGIVLLMTSRASAIPIVYDEFEYSVLAADGSDCSAFFTQGWSWVKANNCVNHASGAGRVYTTDAIATHQGPFPSGGARVLALEALPVTYGGQTDFYLQIGGDGEIGQIPAQHWIQFWIYSEHSTDRPSLFTPQSKFLYYNRATYYPATLSNEGYVFLAGLHHYSRAPLFADPCPAFPAEEFVCDRGFFSTTWESGSEAGLVHGNVNNHIDEANADLGANLDATAHVVPNQWTLVRMHFDLTGTDPRAAPGQAVYEQWIRRDDEAEFTKTTEYIGGVTQVAGQVLDFYPRYTDGFRMLRIPTTIGSSTYPDDPRDNTRNYWIYVDDFVLATELRDLPTYGPPPVAPAAPTNLRIVP